MGKEPNRCRRGKENARLSILSTVPRNLEIPLPGCLGDFLFRCKNRTLNLVTQPRHLRTGFLSRRYAISHRHLINEMTLTKCTVLKANLRRLKVARMSHNDGEIVLLIAC
jgi:hypothetical protein